MDRVLTNTGALLTVSFYVDETLTDPTGNVATVTVTKASDGTAIVTAGATTRLSAGKYQYTLAPLALPELLTLVWSGTFSGVAQTVTTYAEVVGQRIIPLADLRAYDTVLANTTKYPTATLERWRVYVEDEFQAITLRPFIQRYGETTETDMVWGATTLLLCHNLVTSIRSITVDGVAISTSNYHVDSGRVLVLEDMGFVAGTTVVVKYTYGMTSVPLDIQDAALRRVRSKALDQSSGIPDRATSFQPGEGGTYSLAVPGRSGWDTAIPEVDVVLNRWSLRIPGVG